MSTQNRGRLGTWPLRLFFLLFLLIGITVLIFLVIIPWMNVREANTWPETPCIILQSNVTSHRGSKGGTLYDLNLKYRYEVQGLEYTAQRYQFLSSSSSSRGWRDEFCAKYPPGTQAVCYVNPENPREAIFSRALPGEVWFGIIPGIFVLVGLSGLIGSSRKPGTIDRPENIPLRSVSSATPTAIEGEVELKPGTTPKQAFIGLLIFALLWNGVLWGAFLDMSTEGGWFGTAFFGIFALIGLGLAAMALHQFLASFNPVPKLVANAECIPLGGNLTLTWSFQGNVSRIEQLTIQLTASEHATYRRGTSNYTDKNYFADIILLETTERGRMSSGQITINIPGGLMHTFEATNNKVSWKIHLTGVITCWPDISMEYPITVLPAATEC